MKKLSILSSFLLLMTFSPLLGHAIEDSSTTPKVSPPIRSEAQVQVSKLIQNAQSWYWLARSTENSFHYYDNSENTYDKATELAKKLPFEEREPYLSIAVSGKEQTEWRKFNAWDTIRNVFPAIWWLLDDDQTIEIQDDDVEIRALDNAWASIEAGLLKLRIPMLFVYPRCQNHDSCGGLRDEILGLANENDRFYGIPDDEMATLLPETWLSLREGNNPSQEDIKALRTSLNTDRLVLVDITMADEIEKPLRILRVDLRVIIVSLLKNQVLSGSSSAGFVLSHVERRDMYVYWYVTLLLAALVFMILVIRVKGLKDFNMSTQSVLVFLGFVLGITLGFLAGELSGEFAPEWGEIALDPNGNFPRLTTFMWPLVHGAVIVWGPMVLSAFILLRVRDKLPERLQENISLIIFLPAIQAGGLATLFAPLIVAWPGEGVMIAGALSAAALVMSVILASPIESALGMKLDQVDDVPFLPLALGTMGLIILLPFGLFAPVRGIFSGIPMHYTIAGTSLVIAAVVWKLTSNKTASLDETTSKEIDFVNFDGEGSIYHPKWVERKTANILRLTETFSLNGFHCLMVVGEQGIGKTRFISEITKKLEADNFVITSTSCDKPPLNNERSSEPFGLISKSLGPLLGFGDLGLQQSKIDQSSKAFSGLEDQLASLPGVGTLFGLSNDSDSEAASKGQVIHDVTIAVRKQVKNSPLGIVLDDLQWADESSIELLSELIRLLNDKSEELENPTALLLSVRDSNNEDIASIREMLKDQKHKADEIILDEMNKDELEQLLVSVGLTKGPPNVVEDIHEYLGTGNPLHWLEFLRGLVRSGQAQVDDQSRLEILVFDTNQWRSSVPPDLISQVEARIESLPTEDILLLECAAQIGRKFSISELAAGVSMDRMKVLTRLRELEDQTSVIQDQDNNDDYFSIDSEVTRDVLQNRTLKTTGKDIREVVKEMHFLIANNLILNSPLQVNQIFENCLLAGSRMQVDAIKYAIESARSAANKFAWPEVIVILNKVSYLSSTASQEQNDQISFLSAIAFRGVGGQENRDQARNLALSLVESQHIDLFDVLYLYLETSFEEKQKDDLQQIVTQVEEWKKGIKLEGLSEPLSEFYRISAEAELMGRNRDRIAYRKGMNAVRVVVENFSPSTDQEGIQQKRLLSFIIQSLAIDYSFEQKIDKKTESLIEELFSQSEELKKEVNDLQGLAINLGSRGSYHLFTTKKISIAREFLSRDLELCEQMGTRGDMSAIYNKLSMCDWIDANECTDADEKKLLQNNALQNAEKAFRLAVELDREGDRAFAGFAVLEYARINSNWPLIDEVGKNLDDEELWQIVLSSYAKSRVLEECKNLKGKGEWKWLESLQAKVSTSMDG